jgi:hypothetical protein
MTDLLLRPDVEGRGNGYEVIADGQVVGRISLFSSSPPTIDDAKAYERAWRGWLTGLS